MLSLQLAGAMTAVVVLVGGLAYLVTVHRQRAQVDATLQYVIGQNRTGSVDPCAWLFVLRDGRLVGTEQAPTGLPLRPPVDSVLAGAPGATMLVRAGGTEYAVRTQRHGGEVRQAAFDERYQLSDRRQLMTALFMAELIGLLVAALTGRLLAGLAIAPLNEALARQRRFVADASHELRTPLTRLHTRAQLLLHRSGSDLPSGVTEELLRIVAGTRELNEIVDDLLSSAGLSASRPAGGPVDLAVVAGAVADAEAPRARQADVLIVVRREAQTTVVTGIESALRRMVSALVDNAIGHSRPGGHIWLTVSAPDRGRLVELVVADDGTGLDPADRRRVFERFNRGSNASAGRHGLGLALVHEVVEAHGGTVGADGRPGAGSAFTVRLPAAPQRRGRGRNVAGGRALLSRLRRG
jgi:signal transduction histidine kinase